VIATEPGETMWEQMLQTLVSNLSAVAGLGLDGAHGVGIPQTDEELWTYVATTWGVHIPRQAVCPGHVAPFTAFSDAYFARDDRVVVEAYEVIEGEDWTFVSVPSIDEKVTKCL
jgi:hypothetical protein